MKLFTKLSLLVTFSLFASANLNAGWMVVNEDGSMTPYTEDCCKVVVKKVRRHKVCNHCDYSRFPDAETMPLEPGEHYRAAKLGFCGCPTSRR